MQNDIDLLALAKDKSDDSRRKLASITAEHLLSQARDFTDAELLHFGGIFSLLYNFLDEQTKRKIAATVAIADWAPKSLLQSIAYDQSDIAGPVLSFSPIFLDEDLETIVRRGTIGHHLKIAERPFIGEIVSSALVDVNEIKVIEVLSKNRTAAINEETMERAMNIAKSDVSIVDNFMVRRDVSDRLREIAVSLGSKIAPIEAKKQNPVHSRIDKIAKNLDIKSHHQASFDPADAFFELTKGHIEEFFDKVCAHFEINKEQLLAAFDKKKIEPFVLFARAIHFDLTQVSGMIRALEYNDVYRPEFRLSVESLWTKYDQKSALEHLRNSISPRKRHL